MQEHLNPTTGRYLILFSVLFLTACSSTAVVQNSADGEAIYAPQTSEPEISTLPSSTEELQSYPTEVQVEPTASPMVLAAEIAQVGAQADVLSVSASGDENAYQFSVKISSPDTGCEQYADWWEVISENGDLIYRRILAHSHVTEQPFTRSGGPVTLDVDAIVIVRAHMNRDGYGGTAYRGSVASGFEAVELEPGFAAGLEQVDPLPDGCGF